MYTERFHGLTELLRVHENLWRQRPFVQLPVPWESDYPALSAAFRSLSPEEILRYESAPAQVPAVRSAAPELISKIASLTEWPELSGIETMSGFSVPAPKRVSARKWSQVAAFAEVVTAHSPAKVSRVVDWCGGKGHLAGALSRLWDRPVTCVEIDPDLCEAGRQENAIRGGRVQFVCEDALSDAASEKLDNETAAAALHACGDLHRELARAAAGRRVPYLAIAPCCFQRIEGMQYRPMSKEAAAAGLSLSRHELRLPSLDETKTGEAARARRRKEQAFRLGTDLLLREAAGEDCYVPLGRIRPAWLREGFEFFARKMAARKQRRLPARVDWQRAEAAGWERFYLASALGMARGLFRRAIESWLVLDLALYLESEEYRVTVGTFCAPPVTPRNFILLARRCSGREC